MPDFPPEPVLIEKARSGDADAFAALCERCRARLWRVAASVADARDAEDLAQEAILRAWTSLAGYRADAPFEAWLCRIALNAAHDHRRSAWYRRVLTVPWSGQGPPDDAGPESLVEQRDVARRVRKAVAALPEKQRVPVWLHYFEGYGFVEIARLEGASESTIRSRIQAALRRLGPWLAGLEPNGDAGLGAQPNTEGCPL